jgi:hypothetical protein
MVVSQVELAAVGKVCMQLQLLGFGCVMVIGTGCNQLVWPATVIETVPSGEGILDPATNIAATHWAKLRSLPVKQSSVPSATAQILYRPAYSACRGAKNTY